MLPIWSGAGLGSIAILGLLFVFQPPQALIVLGLCGILAALVSCWELQQIKPVVRLLILAVALMLMPASWSNLKYQPIKGLARHYWSRTPALLHNGPAHWDYSVSWKAQPSRYGTHLA